MPVDPGGWTAIIPLKPAGQRKSRLAPDLSPQRRAVLSETMFAHVAATLRAVAKISRIALLSAEREGWTGIWLADTGLGLNQELQAARLLLGTARLLVIHADLPLLSPADIDLLLAGAETTGCAMAPDRHGTGTNALAICGSADFSFAFGAGSLQRHRAEAAGQAAIIDRPGTALDIDTPDDLQAARGLGFIF